MILLQKWAIFFLLIFKHKYVQIYIFKSYNGDLQYLMSIWDLFLYNFHKNVLITFDYLQPNLIISDSIMITFTLIHNLVVKNTFLFINRFVLIFLYSNIIDYDSNILIQYTKFNLFFINSMKFLLSITKHISL